MIQPQCWVSVGGVKLTGQPSAAAPVALSGVAVTWGRSEMFGQADPATARLEVFDPTSAWATGTDARDTTDLVEEHLLIGWTHEGVDRVLFRGRVAGVAVEPATAGGVDGARVLIDATSRIADLGNSAAPARGAEILGDRLAALQSAAAGYFADAVQFITAPGSNVVGNSYNHYPQTVRPVPADASTYAAVVALYDATASKLSYLPDQRWLLGIDRRTAPVARGLAGLVRAAAGEAREGQGAYRASLAITLRQGQTGTAGSPNATPRRLYLDGAVTGRPDGGWLTRRAEQRVARLDLTYRASTTYADTVATRTVGRRFIPAGPSVQSAAVEVETVGATDAGLLADDYADALASEGAGWIPTPVTLDTAVTGGFDTLDQATELLAGGETTSLLFLQRTGYPRLRQRPVFGVMGGVIEHYAGAWRVTLNPTPVFSSERQHAVTWAEIDDGTEANTLRWHGDGAAHADALHESVTFADLAYCSTGLGVTVPGPDTGSDTYQ
jgi:hypothetical protein